MIQAPLFGLGAYLFLGYCLLSYVLVDSVPKVMFHVMASHAVSLAFIQGL